MSMGSSGEEQSAGTSRPRMVAKENQLKNCILAKLKSVGQCSITSVTKGSYSITGKACNLILLTELHFIIFYKVTKSFR
jgi:hypothetical protein